MQDEIGTLTQCLWSCRLIQNQWNNTDHEMLNILIMNLELDPFSLLWACNLTSVAVTRLFNIMTFAARNKHYFAVDC